MLAPLTFAVFGALAPLLSRRIGLEWSMVLSLAILGGGELARSAMHDTSGFLAWSFVSMAGTGAVNVYLPPMVKKYFPDRIATMSTIYLFLAVLGSVIPAYLAAPLVSASDWRVSIAAWGYLAVVAIIPWIGVLMRSRQSTTAPSAPTSDRHITVRVWRSPAAWGISVAFGIAAFNCYIMWGWLPILLQERAGMDEATSGLMLAIYSAIALPNSIIAPMIIARVKSMTWVILYGMAVLIIGTLGLWLAPATLTWLWVVFSGFGVIFFTVGLVLINLRTSSPSGAVALSGMVQGVGYLIGAVGPLLVGLIHAVNPDGAGIFTVILGSALVGIFPLFVLRRRVFVDAA